MNPYIAWAKTYRRKNVREAGKESWRAGWLLSLYEKTVDKIAAAWKPEPRFNDEAKALLFIGYLAGYPKKEDAGEDTDCLLYTSYIDVFVCCTSAGSKCAGRWRPP